MKCVSELFSQCLQHSFDIIVYEVYYVLLTTSECFILLSWLVPWSLPLPPAPAPPPPTNGVVYRNFMVDGWRGLSTNIDIINIDIIVLYILVGIHACSVVYKNFRIHG